MDKKVWLSSRALKLHAVILVVVPSFMALCIWQIDRATSGNELSWAYVFEWPFFAAYAVYMWWRLLHAAPEGTPPGSPAGPPPGGRAETAGSPTSTVDGAATTEKAAHAEQDIEKEDGEDAELAAYNEYLAQLAERDRAGGR